MRKYLAGLCAIGLLPVAAVAQPNVDSAAVFERVFNDDGASTLTTVNNYGTQVSFSDTPTVGGGGFANLHVWRVSDDAGGSAAQFANSDSFSLFSDVTISGTGDGEGGMNLSPWWSPSVDGRFNMRTTDGEVAVFGGRLPFYSFTGSHGVTYTKGDTVRLGIVYSANSLSSGDPATVEYIYDDGTVYSSGALAFDEGNPAEGMGSWGMLDNATTGGYMQIFLANGGTLTTSWDNINYIPAPGASVLALLGVGALTRRRR